MNHQVNYIIQGFILALLIPTGFFVADKIFAPPESETSAILTHQESISKEPALTEAATKGKIIFMQKCAACHNLFKDQTGPSLIGFEQRGPWQDRQILYAWIRNPSAFMKENTYARELKAKYGSMMPAFPEITDEEIDNIVAYINHAGETQVYQNSKIDLF